MDSTSDPGGLHSAVVELRREFAAGLDARLDEMRSALAALTATFDPAEVERLYLRSHALDGTAAAYDARAVSTCAAALAALVRGWRHAPTPTRPDVAAATTLLDALADAIAAFRTAINRHAT